MDWREKQALSNCRVFFVENIHDVTDLLDDFIQAGLVSVDNAEEISVQTTKLKRKQAFLNQLPTWGAKTYSVLVKSLERTGYQHVCEKLDEELKFVQHTKSVPRHRDTVPSWCTHHIGGMMVSERALHLLSQELPPPAFYILGSCLGLAYSRLQHFTASHSHTPSVQLSTMLCEWRASHSNKATVETLVIALRKAKVDEDLYRDILLDDLGVLKGQNMEQIHRMDSISSSVSGRAEQWV